MAHTVSPVWVTGHYRFENDDGSLTTSTFKALQDTTITQPLDTNFRLRMNWGDSAGQSTSTPLTPKLEFRINAGAWTVVTSSSACFASASTNETDDATSTTERLTTAPTGCATYVDSRFEETDGILPSDTPADAYHEAVFNLQLNSVSISNTDTVDFRIVDSSGTETITTVDTTPTLTVGSPTLPNWISGHFRFENDDGNVSTSTFIDAEDTDVSIELDTNFRVRMNWGEADGQTTASAFKPKLEFRKNGGSWGTVGTTGDVKIVDSTFEVDESTTVDERLTTAPLGCATYVDTRFADVNSALPPDTPVDAYHEAVFNMSMDSATAANGDYYEFRLVDSNVVETFDTVQTIPKVTAGSAVTGTSVITELDDTSVASGTSITPITGSSSITEIDDTSTASGEEEFTGSSTITEIDDTSTASGEEEFTGSSSITEIDDTSIASGTSVTPVTGNSNITEIDDTSIASGTSIITGSSAITEIADTSLASGEEEFTGSSDITEIDDTSIASGTSIITGSSDITEIDDTGIASGTSVDGVSGTAAIVELGDTSSASGEEEFTGSSTITEIDDTSIASGTSTDGVSGSSAITEVSDTSSASGTSVITGSSDITEIDDTSIASGTSLTPVTGSSTITEVSDTSIASGTSIITGSSAIIEISDTSSASGEEEFTGSSAIIEIDDSSLASGTSVTPVTGSSAITEIDDTSIASGTVSSDAASGKTQSKSIYLSGTVFDLVTSSSARLGNLSNNNIVIAERSGDDRLERYIWNGYNFTLLGNPLYIVNGVKDIAGLTSTRCVLLDGNDTLQSYDHDGTNWSAVGNANDLGILTEPKICGLTSSRIAEFDSTNNEIRAYDFDGTNWTLTGAGFSLTNVEDLARISDTDIVVVTSNDRLSRYTFNGTLWSLVGSTSADMYTGSLDLCNLSVLGNGTVILTDNTGIVITVNWNGSTFIKQNEEIISGVTTANDICTLNEVEFAWIDDGNDELRVYEVLEGIVESDDTNVSSGSTIITGSSALTELDDTSIASGEFIITSVGGNPNIEWAVGTNTTWGDGTNTEWDGISSIITEDNDTSISSGTVSASAVIGSSTTTEIDDTSISSGTLTVTSVISSLNIEWADDTNTTWGDSTNTEWSTNEGIIQEAADTVVSEGLVIVNVDGSVVITELDDTSTSDALSIVPVSGTATITELDDSSSAVGTAIFVVSGNVSTIEDNDYAIAKGKRKALNKMYVGTELVTAAYKGSEPASSVYLGTILLED